MSSRRSPRTRREFLVDTIVGAGIVATGACFPQSPPKTSAQHRFDGKIATLRDAVSGLVLTPSDALYKRYRPVFNRRFDSIFPAVIVMPNSVPDVQATIGWVRHHGFALGLRGGGHSYLGNSICEGVVIDLRNLNAVRLAGAGRDTAGEIAVEVGGGARLIHVASALGRKRLALPLGSCPSVGVGGFTLGGGIGLSSRLLGLASDRLLEVELVTAEGRVVQASARENPGLFWACQGGGGGQLGIVTRMRMRAHRAEQVSWFTMDVDWDRAADALRYWQDWAPDAPRELTCMLQLFSRPKARCIGQFYGSATRLRDLLVKLGRVANATPKLGQGTSAEASMVWADCQGRSLAQCSLPADNQAGLLRRKHYEARGLLFERALPDQAITQIFQYIADRSRMPVRGLLLLDALGGAVADLAPWATAFAHRSARFSGQIINHGPLDEPYRRWIADFWSALKPFASRGIYSNYSFAGLDNWQQAIWGDNLRRMLAEKRAWDPDDVFTGRQILSAKVDPTRPLSIRMQ